MDVVTADTIHPPSKLLSLYSFILFHVKSQSTVSNLNDIVWVSYNHHPAQGSFVAYILTLKGVFLGFFHASVILLIVIYNT